MDVKPAVIFDLDGTLIDSEKIATQVTKDYFYSLGITVTKAHLTCLIGRPWKPAIEELLRLYPLEQSFDLTLRDLLQAYRNSLSKKVPTIPGSLSLIPLLAKEFRLGIVSGSHQKDIARALESLDLKKYFETIVGYEDTRSYKPSPEPYFEIIRRLKLQEERVLVFEDSVTGITSARAAGLEVVAIRLKQSDKKTFPGINVIKDFTQIDSTWIKSKAQPIRHPKKP